MTIDILAPIVSPARYAKNMMAVRCPSDGSGFKTRAMYLASALPHRYSGREHAYIMSRAAAARLIKLYEGGWDATCFGELMAPEVPILTALQYRAACNKLGLTTYRAMAKELGISKDSAHRYAKGQWDVPETVAKLLRALVELGRTDV